jgi:hypothetical protein
MSDYVNKNTLSCSVVDADPHQSDKLDLDPHQFADDKSKCIMSLFELFFQGFETLFGS